MDIIYVDWKRGVLRVEISDAILVKLCAETKSKNRVRQTKIRARLLMYT